jgi:large repetitive protein
LSTSARRALTVLLGVSLSVVGLSTVGPTTVHAAGTPIFTESFKNNTVGDSHWVIGGSNFTPCLTASGNSTVTPIMSCAGTTDAAGAGAARLTNATGNESGFIFYNSPLPDTAGINVTFDTYQYSGTGADGIAFFMTDGQYQLLTPGQAGGYLGYAGGNHGIGVGNGVAHGLFGLGLDAYGNFSNFENDPAQGGGNCPNSYTPSLLKDAVVLRGPGNADQLNYCHLAGALAPRTLHVDAAVNRTDGGANDVVRHVTIVVDPSTNVAPKVTVSIDGTQVLQAPEPAMSPTVKFGWTASTGGSTNIHEIQNVSVTTINPLGPSLSVSNTVNSGGIFASGGPSGDAAYTITNSAGANFETQPFTLTVPVPAGLGFTGTTVSDPNMVCTASTATQLSCTYTPTGYGFASAQSVTVHLLFSPTSTYSHKDLVLTASVTSTDGGSPTANQTLQVYPRAVPSAITTTANVPATVAQGANGTVPFTWTVGTAANPALVSTATVDASGNVTMTPVAGASGTTTIPLSVLDASGLTSATANIVVTVRPTIAAVVGSGTGPAPVFANVPAPVGTGPYVYTFATTPNPATQGTAQFVAGSPEQVKFTPVQGFSGAVPTFTYSVTDAGGVPSATATVDITVIKPVAPTVADVSGTIDANTVFTQTVPAPSGASPFGYAITALPAAGTETISSGGLVTFTPPNNTSGVYSSTYQAQDQYSQPSNSGQIQVTVRPVAANFSGTTLGTSPLTVSAPAPVGTGPFTWASAPPQGHGTLAMNGATGQVIFTATLGYSGTFTFPYSISDKVGTSSTAKVVTITVTAPPAPVALPYTSTQNADNNVSAQLPAPSSGTSPFTYSVVAPPSSGLLVLTPSGNMAYTPVAGTSGIVTFTYSVTDPYGSASQPATVTLNFLPIAPMLVAFTVGPQPVDIPVGSVDGTGPFVYAVTVAPARGTVTVDSATGVFTYTPPLGFSGFVFFWYTATGAGPTTSAQTEVQVFVGKPSVPIVSSTSATTLANVAVDITTPAATGTPPLTFAISTAPARGTATISPTTGVIHYTPNANVSGIDTLKYTATDPYSQTSIPATVTIDVFPIAASPVTGSSTGPNPVIVTPGAPTGTGAFTYALVPASVPPLTEGTTVEDPSTGKITFTPVIGFSGTVTFQYTVSDAAGLTSAPGTVSFTVNKPSAPTVSPASATTPANTAVDITPPAATGTPPLTFAISTAPTRGTATISATGVIHYTPNLNVSGVDTLRYTATDPYGATSAPAVVTINVHPIAASPVTGSSTGPAPVIATPGAPTGTGPFTYTLVPGSLPPLSEGTTVEVPSTGQITFTPASGVSGTVTFQYTVTDGAGLTSAPGTVNFTVTKPAGPVVSPASATTPANIAVDITPAAATGTAPLSYMISTAPTRGAATISAAGVIHYTPNSNVSGVDTLQYTASDSYGQTSAPAVVTITILPIAASPVTGSSTGPNPVIATPGAPVGTGPFTYGLVGTLPPLTEGTTVEDPSTGKITFTPVIGFSGTVAFQYTVTDATGTTSAPATVTFTVSKPAAPGVSPASATTPANTAVDITPPAATGTPPLTFAISTAPTRGTATISGAGVIHYAPNLNTSGVDTLQYTASDPYGTTSTPAVVTINVLPIAASPVTGSSTGPNPVIATPGAPTGTGPFTYTLVPGSLPPLSEGTTVEDPGTGQITFTPASGFSGVVTFQYTVTDAATLTSAPATVIFTVGVPAAPVVSPTSVTTPANTPLDITPPAATGTPPLSYVISTAPTRGAATISTAGVIHYTPNPNTSGVDTLQYTATDAYTQTSVPATVTITVLPIAASPVTGSSTGPNPVIATPGPPVGTGPFTYSLLGTLPPLTEGTTVEDPTTGQITFTPVVGFSGAVMTFQYTVTDASGVTSAPGKVTFTVTNPPAPVVFPKSATTPVNVAVDIAPAVATGTGTLIYAISAAPTLGMATISAAGVIHYTPTLNVSGVDSLQYMATDLYAQTSAPATVTITVTPMVADVSATTTVNIAAHLQPITPTGSEPFTWTIGTGPPSGTVTIDPATGAMVFTPAPGASGTVLYTFIAIDQSGTASQPATATVLVKPVAWPISTTVAAASGPVVIALPLPSGTGPFTCAVVTSSLPPASAGSVTINATTCIITFTPAAGFSGTVDIQYTVTDASGLTSAPALGAFGVLAATATANNTAITPQVADTGAHLWRYALQGGILMALGILMLILGAVTRRRRGNRGLSA